MWTRRRFLGATSSSAVVTAFGSALSSARESDGERSQGEKLSPLDAARGVLHRQLGSRSSLFNLSLLNAPRSNSSASGNEEYEIESIGGVVHIAGTSAIALCRGAYAYLREQCGAMITWSGKHVELPATLPPLAKTRVRCPYQHVQYLNPCTYGYTMAFWDWSRWEKELDWMALHGITMPLALVGQEWVWQNLWRDYGLSQAEIDEFSVGPGQLPWHWMGNINNFAGPLPQNWIEEHRLLQHRILDRMRSLGMKPVAPAFSGFVPKGFLRVHPEAEIFTLLWLEKAYPTLPRNTRTFILHPAQEALYREIGSRFIQAYKAEFGEFDYYLADTFNELAVPVSKDNRYADLERFGRTVYGGIEAGDPKATWVMQGWLFVFDPFWDPQSVEALLRGVPNDRMLILDYSNDLVKGQLDDRFAPSPWKRNHAFFGKQWCHGMAHTFGGNNNVKGNLELIASESASILSNSDKGNLVGWSICPEGIETNEVVYELMTDACWSSSAIDLAKWLPTYCVSRYGSCPPAMTQAWSLLLKSAYSTHIWVTKQAWQTEPSLTPAAESVDAGPLFVEAAKLFLSCAGSLGSVPMYRNDLIEFVSQAAGGWVDQQLALATELIRSKEYSTAKIHAANALDMLQQIDALMNLRPDRRLETWVNAARAQAATSDEAAFYDQNSRLLITTWGWPELSDYASRVWAGLIRDYYAARWKAWFEHQWSGADFSLEIWQLDWLSKPYQPSTPTTVVDLIATAESMMTTWGFRAAKVAGQA
ncbi:MAG: alpha-N-acetylglucosaminidase [Terracidiphilus sp.]|nr:alpha-N-acetylglucosaminidase [Terracidiphilus sp.]